MSILMSSPLCHLQYTTLFLNGADFSGICFDQLTCQPNDRTIAERDTLLLCVVSQTGQDLASALHYLLVVSQLFCFTLHGLSISHNRQMVKQLGYVVSFWGTLQAREGGVSHSETTSAVVNSSRTCEYS